jgi:hypothetical protein
MVRDSDQSENDTEDPCPNGAAPSLVEVGHTEHDRRDDHREPGGATAAHDCGHHEAPKQELFAKPGGEGEEKKQGGFAPRAREKPRTEGAQPLEIRMARASHALQVGPVRDGDEAAANQADDKNAAALSAVKPELARRPRERAPTGKEWSRHRASSGRDR